MSFKIRSSGFISLQFAGIGCNGPLQIKNFPLPALRESDSIDGCKVRHVLSAGHPCTTCRCEQLEALW